MEIELNKTGVTYAAAAALALLLALVLMIAAPILLLWLLAIVFVLFILGMVIFVAYTIGEDIEYDRKYEADRLKREEAWLKQAP